MILTRPERAKAYLDRGIYGSQTLQMVFARLAQAKPGALAFADVDDKGRITPRPRDVAHAQVEALAALFATVGLRTDQVIGLYMPNCVDAWVAVLAAWRAGLIVVPLPIAWSREEITAAIEAVSIRAVITLGQHQGEPLGETIRDVAMENFAIRFIFGFGADLPDGLMSVDDAIGDPALIGLAPELNRPGNMADHVALITWSRETGARETGAYETGAYETGARRALVPVPWSHNQLIVCGLAHVLEAKIDAGSGIFSAFDPSGLPAFIGGLVSALLAESPLYCHSVESMLGLGRALVMSGAKHWLLPATIATTLTARLGESVRPKLSLVTRELVSEAGTLDGFDVIDLYHPEGISLLPVRREDGLQSKLRIGAHIVPSGSVRGLALGELRLDAREKQQDHTIGTPKTVYIRGPVVPDAPWPNHVGSIDLMAGAHRDGFIASRWRAGEPPLGIDDLLPAAEPSALVTFGSQTTTMAQISRVYSGLPGVRGAVAILVQDEEVGPRLGVSVVLDALGYINKSAWEHYFNGLNWPEDLRPKVIKTVRLLPREDAPPSHNPLPRGREGLELRRGPSAISQAGAKQWLTQKS